MSILDIMPRRVVALIRTHASRTADVHGVAAGQAFETAAGAQTKANAAQAAAEATAAGALSTHNGAAGVHANLADPAAATAGLRTLGTGANQACGGADVRLSNAREPLTHVHRRWERLVQVGTLEWAAENTWYPDISQNLLVTSPTDRNAYKSIGVACTLKGWRVHMGSRIALSGTRAATFQLHRNGTSIGPAALTINAGGSYEALSVTGLTVSLSAGDRLEMVAVTTYTGPGSPGIYAITADVELEY